MKLDELGFKKIKNSIHIVEILPYTSTYIHSPLQTIKNSNFTLFLSYDSHPYKIKKLKLRYLPNG